MIYRFFVELVALSDFIMSFISAFGENNFPKAIFWLILGYMLIQHLNNENDKNKKD